MLFEILLLVVSYVSHLSRGDGLKWIAHMLVMCVLLCLSYIGYYSVRAPTSLPNAFAVDNAWRIISLLQFVWLLSCSALFLYTRRPFIQNLYFLGLWLYILCGGVLLLFVYRTVAATLRKSRDQLREMKVGHDATITPAFDLHKVQIARRRVRVLIALVTFVLILSTVSLVWHVAMIDTDIETGCDLNKRKQCRMSKLPFADVSTFLFHYISVLAFFVGVLVQMWRGRTLKDPHLMSTDTVQYKVCRCCFKSNSGWLRRAQSAEVPDLPLASPASPVANHVELGAFQIDAVDNVLEEVEESVMETMLLEMARDTSMPSILRPVTQFPNQLSETHLGMALGRIDSDGDILGKRGVKKLKKKKGESFRYDDIRPITEDALRERALSQSLKKRGVGGHTITALSSKHHNRATLSETVPTHDVGAHIPCTTVVLELSAVLLTQSAKIERKTARFVAGATDTLLAMLFGGEERLQLLKEWLSERTRQQQQCKFFVVTEEDSKMVMSLLQKVGLLRYFVSTKANEPRKLLSHVIGYNHKMARGTQGKRHLLLMKLMQFVGCRHQEMLYVGGDEQMVRHVKAIQVSRTYRVKTKGVTAADLKQIDAMCV